ncbi:hypothetical protein [Proteocatella sphenisci]|uniref:hypothetical protein n=1 Tax=Proteocatella sphenisci TaxID=181070 RepID=UPI00048C27D9|nr:hypothetical protein [Proteocatella sphenisci]
MLEKVRCANDGKRLFDMETKLSKGPLIEIKCPHCGKINEIHIKDGYYTVKCRDKSPDSYY